MCLSDKNLDILAPKKSYIEDFADRSSVINIHHVIHHALKDSDNPDNLISLCKKHHSEYGKDLDPVFIKKSLIMGGKKYDPWNDEYIGYVFSIKTYNTSKMIKIYFRK